MNRDDYIRNGKPTTHLKLARQQLEEFLEWHGDGNGGEINVSDWPDDVIADLVIDVREWLADEARTCDNPFSVASLKYDYSCITRQRHLAIIERFLNRYREQVEPIIINGKSYTIAAARDYLDALENCGRAS